MLVFSPAMRIKRQKNGPKCSKMQTIWVNNNHLSTKHPIIITFGNIWGFFSFWKILIVPPATGLKKSKWSKITYSMSPWYIRNGTPDNHDIWFAVLNSGCLLELCRFLENFDFTTRCGISVSKNPQNNIVCVTKPRNFRKSC